MTTRSRWLATMIVTACSIASLSSSHVTAETPASPPTLDEAIARGLDYLAKQQGTDGSLASMSAASASTTAPATNASPATTIAVATTNSTAAAFPATPPTTTTAATTTASVILPESTPVGTTSLGVLAFLASGNAPDVGRHGLVVRSAVDFILDKVPDDGYVGAIRGEKGDDSRMLGQAVAMIALAQDYGVEADADARSRIRITLTKMLHATLVAQAVQKPEPHAGGWGATPDAKNSDAWTTGWNVLALRACKDIGLPVPDESMHAARSDLMKCRNPTDHGFALQPGAPGDASATAVAILCLSSPDADAPAESIEAMKFLASLASNAPSAHASPLSTYAILQAAATTDDPAAASRAASAPALDALLKSQLPDGSWPSTAAPGTSGESAGRASTTTAAVLTLAVPYKLLPLFAR